MKGFSFGQYYPADSILHRLDPRMKIILALLYVITAFICKNTVGAAALLLSSIVLVLLSKIPVRTVLRSIRPVLFIIAFTAIINIFLTSGDTLLVEWKFIHIYAEGLWNAAIMMIRIFVLIVGMGMFMTYTTTPIMLTDAIEQLLSPLKKIKVPVHEFAMMMTIALRFIPTLMEETEKIMSAQKARGADFTNGSVISRVRALIPILVPLVVSSFRRADELATAMECRCYHGGNGRTRMTQLRYAARDFAWLAGALIFCGGCIALNYLRLGFSL
jgi:energy-coupling factor transport system permease protein